MPARPSCSLASLFLAAALLFLGGCGPESATDNTKPSCADAIGCVEIAANAPFKIGVLQATSGKVANLGREQIRGLELALARRGNQLLGHPVTTRTEDTGCTAEGGANAALKLIADPDTVAIFGTTCSGAAATAAHIASGAGLTMISGNNSAPNLTAIGGKKAKDWHAGYFRTAPNEENAGRAAAIYARDQLHISKAAVINDGDIYTRGLTDGFAAAFRSKGGEIVLDTTLAKGEKEVAPFLEGVLLSGARLLFFPLFQPEGNRLLRAARRLSQAKGVVLMSGGALIENSFLEDVGNDAIGMYFVGPALPKDSPAARDLLLQYKAAYRQAPSNFYYMSAYDAANILLAALEKTAVKAGDGSVTIGRAALREAVAATHDFPGVTGRLTCDRFGDCAAPRFNILRLDDPAAGVDGLQRNIMFTYAPK